MPALSPARGWATLQAQLLRELRGFDPEALRHVHHIRVTSLNGPASTEKREQSLAAQMAEQAAMGVGDAEAMALRKARAKVALRSAMDNQLHRVAPGLFIAAVGGAKNLEAIRAAGITHIVNASPLVPCFHEGSPGLEYRRVDVYDTADADLAAHFAPVSAHIAGALAGGGAVLVHCYAGQSRSAALVAAHLMLAGGLTLGGALEAVRAGRPAACPNLGFIAQLKRLERRAAEEAPVQKAKAPPARPTGGDPRHAPVQLDGGARLANDAV